MISCEGVIPVPECLFSDGSDKKKDVCPNGCVCQVLSFKHGRHPPSSDISSKPHIARSVGTHLRRVLYLVLVEVLCVGVLAHSSRALSSLLCFFALTFEAPITLSVVSYQSPRHRCALSPTRASPTSRPVMPLIPSQCPLPARENTKPVFIYSVAPNIHSVRRNQIKACILYTKARALPNVNRPSPPLARALCSPINIYSTTSNQATSHQVGEQQVGPRRSRIGETLRSQRHQTSTTRAQRNTTSGACTKNYDENKQATRETHTHTCTHHATKKNGVTQ